jgi:hypothetical protein
VAAVDHAPVAKTPALAKRRAKRDKMKRRYACLQFSHRLYARHFEEKKSVAVFQLSRSATKVDSPETADGRISRMTDKKPKICDSFGGENRT